MVEIFGLTDPITASAYASTLLDRLSSLPAILSADAEALLRIVGDPAIVKSLDLIRRAMLRSLELEAFQGPVFASSVEVINYLHTALAFRPSEEVRALFLDAGNRLLKEETLCVGTIDEAPVYNREIVRRALDLNAAGLVLVHNHPSGDPEPSDVDLHVTRNVARTLAQVGVKLHDHLVVSRAGWRSIRIDHA